MERGRKKKAKEENNICRKGRLENIRRKKIEIRKLRYGNEKGEALKGENN